MSNIDQSEKMRRKKMLKVMAGFFGLSTLICVVTYRPDLFPILACLTTVTLITTLPSLLVYDGKKEWDTRYFRILSTVCLLFSLLLLITMISIDHIRNPFLHELYHDLAMNKFSIGLVTLLTGYISLYCTRLFSLPRH